MRTLTPAIAATADQLARLARNSRRNQPGDLLTAWTRTTFGPDWTDHPTPGLRPVPEDLAEAFEIVAGHKAPTNIPALRAQLRRHAARVGAR